MQKLLERLADELPFLLRQWSPSSYEADYICAFCQMRPKTNQAEIEHRDCLGIALQEELNKSNQ